jgi:hypothetical protein
MTASSLACFFFAAATATTAAALLGGCLLDNEHHASSSTSSSRPTITGLDMPADAQATAGGDYVASGHIRYRAGSAAVVTRKIYVSSTGSEYRSAATSASGGIDEPISVHLPLSLKGQNAYLRVSVIDAEGTESDAIAQTVYCAP